MGVRGSNSQTISRSRISRLDVPVIDDVVITSSAVVYTFDGPMGKDECEVARLDGLLHFPWTRQYMVLMVNSWKHVWSSSCCPIGRVLRRAFWPSVPPLPRYIGKYWSFESYMYTKAVRVALASGPR